MKKKITPGLVRQLATAAYTEWMEKHGDEAHIRMKVFDFLDQSVTATVLALMGFDGSWSEWRLGNNKDSPALKFIEKAAKDAVELWLREQIGELPKLNEQQKAELRRTYVDSYKYKLRDRLQKMAEQRAETDIQRIMKEELGWTEDEALEETG
jgi:hypothetical protein